MRAIRQPISAWLTALTLLVPLIAMAQVHPAQSEAELQALIAARPSDLLPYLRLARLYKDSGRRQDAEQVLRNALIYNRDSGAVYSALAGLHDITKESEAVLALSQEWLSATPNDNKPLLLAAQVHAIRAGLTRDQPSESLVHIDRAIEVLTDAQRIDPDDRMIRAFRLSMLKQRIPFTDDPQERDRLTREVEEGAREFVGAPQSSGVAGSATVTAQASRPYPPNAVRVGGNIKPPNKTKDANAVFPPAAQQAGVQGVVILEVLLDEAGKVADGKVMRSIPLLDQAAIDAVSQWEFEPTLLNGNPVPVIMTVTVQFRLAP